MVSGDARYNSEKVSTLVKPKVDLVILKVKTSPADPVYVGDKVVYTLTVSNNGPCNATGVYVEEIPPATATINLADPLNASWSLVGGKYIWTIGNLAASGVGATTTFAIVPTAPSIS